MLIPGIVLGLLAALSQSVYYLMSRHYSSRAGRTPEMLLAVSHVWMSVISFALLPVVLWGYDLPPIGTWIVPLLRAMCFYLLGHAALFAALRHAEASRVSPLLGLKVMVLALIRVAFQGYTLTPMQWLGIGLVVTAAFVLNASGGSLPWKVVALAGGACLGYSLSDLGITDLNIALRSLGTGRAVVVACFLCFAASGVVGLWLPIRGIRPTRADWKDGLPVGVAWLIAMMFLFGTFACVGVIFGNILQSTRGIQSILLGLGVAHLGWVHLEVKVERGVFWRRFGAATLMVAAIALYLLGRAPELAAAGAVTPPPPGAAAPAVPGPSQGEPGGG